jgi:hypothetical protein
MAVRFQLRRDNSTSWNSVNPILAEGEPGLESDTLKLKIGDGVTNWNNLPYYTTVDFSDIENLPTTLAGYGITDASTTDEMDSAISSAVSDAVSNLVDSSPSTLDTLNELAAALNDDASFATTVSDALGLKANSADLAAIATSGSYNDLGDLPTTLSGYGITDAATSAQGALADTALQSVAFDDLTSTPTTLAGYGITDAATSAQGALADTALQSVAFGDLTSTPTTLAGYGITDAATSAQGALADTALQSVAFGDLTSTPTTLSGYGITDAATSAQGALADTAVQPGDNIETSIIGSTDSSAITITPEVNFDATITVSDIVPSADSVIDIGTSTNSFRSLHAETINTGNVGYLNARFHRIGPDSSYSNVLYPLSTASWTWSLAGPMDPGNIFHNRSDTYVRWKSTGQLVYNHTNPTGTVDVDFLASDTHYFYQPAGALTVNFTNMPTTSNRMYNMRIFINQGATGYIPTSLQIDGVAVVVGPEWQNGIVPTPTANAFDLVQFVLWRVNSFWYVLGQSNSYS